jgi:hypothetical protein
MKNKKQGLTLHQPVTYQIKVPGKLDEYWSDWNGGMKVTVDYDEYGQPITVLTGSVDQAALQGLLSRLYALGLPLISVICVDFT